MAIDALVRIRSEVCMRVALCSGMCRDIIRAWIPWIENKSPHLGNAYGPEYLQVNARRICLSNAYDHTHQIAQFSYGIVGVLQAIITMIAGSHKGDVVCVIRVTAPDEAIMSEMIRSAAEPV